MNNTKSCDTARQSAYNQSEETIKIIKEQCEDEIMKMNIYFGNKISNYENDCRKLEDKVQLYLKEIEYLQFALKEARKTSQITSSERYAEQNSSTTVSEVMSEHNILDQSKQMLVDVTHHSSNSQRGSSLDSVRGFQNLLHKIKYIMLYPIKLLIKSSSKYVDSNADKAAVPTKTKIHGNINLKITHNELDKENADPNCKQINNFHTKPNWTCDDSSIEQITNASFDEESAGLFSNSIKKFSLQEHKGFSTYL